MIKLTNITKTYETFGTKTVVLDRLDLTLHKGESIAVVGKSGSGKSTLLNLIAGTDLPDEGHIELNGIDVGSLSESQRANMRNRHIGYIFQNFNLRSHQTAMFNVMLPALIAGVSVKEAQYLAAEQLEAVGLADFAQRECKFLSGGQRQRVAVARAMINTPTVLLCDEPTGALDSETGLTVFSLIVDRCRELETTLVVVSHDSMVKNFEIPLFTLLNGLLVSI